MIRRLLQVLWLATIPAAMAQADDWPQFRGPHRDAVWNESGVMERFPGSGLKIAWRAAVGDGFSSPVVAQGRVYLADSILRKPLAQERVLCLEERTGEKVWEYLYEVRYPDWAFDPKQKSGPNATPIVQGGRIYSSGQMGDVLCLDAAGGKLVWQRNFMREYGAKEFTGTTPSPLIEGKLLILVPGISPNACVVALDKESGKEIWRALQDPSTYSSPLAISSGGQQQLIVWTPKAVNSLNPLDGSLWWREEVDTANLFGSATPVLQGRRLLVSGLMLELDAERPGATVLWPESKSATKVVLSPCSNPIIEGDHVYAGKASGQLVCLEAKSGRQLWTTDKVTSRQQGATIHLTPQGGTCLVFTDQGNLIRARLSPKGYEELSRVHVVNPTYPFAGRNVVWPPPAYAGRHIFIHNGDELVCASLEP